MLIRARLTCTLGAELGTSLGTAAAGMKVGGGKDTVTEETVGGQSIEFGLSPDSGKLGVKASGAGGLEVSAHIRPGDVASVVRDKVFEKLKEAFKPLAEIVNR